MGSLGQVNLVMSTDYSPLLRLLMMDHKLVSRFAIWLVDQSVGRPADFLVLNLCPHFHFFMRIILYFVRHPESINRLLVIDPGGMFPIQCKEGAFMAILFKWGVPMFFLRSLGR